MELIQEEGVTPEVIKYLDKPPTAKTLHELLGMLGMGARGLLRKSEPEYAELNLANPELTDEQLIQAMIKHPRLIERPIVVSGNRAVIGRPPEKVLDLI